MQEYTRASAESRYYGEIMALAGMEEIKEEVKRWEILAENIGYFPPDEEVLLSDYFWISKAGTGKTKLLQLLAYYLEERQIMSFMGNKKVVEFDLGYCKKEQPFEEMTRLIDCLSYEAGFHRQFRGIVAIHMTEWADHMQEPYMTSFLEFLSANTRDWLIVLCADVSEEKAKAMAKQISYYLRLKTIHISLPSQDALYTYLQDRCETYGIFISDEAGDVLKKTIDVLVKSPHFGGYHTLNLMAQEMIYELYSKKKMDSRQITAEMLTPFGPEGRMTKNYIENAAKKQHIGFSYIAQEGSGDESL